MSAWKSDEKLLSICILNFSFKNDFVWEEIPNIRHSVSSPDETPRSSSKILRCASYFQLSSRCLIWWWNTASHVWYITWRRVIHPKRLVITAIMRLLIFMTLEGKTYTNDFPFSNGSSVYKPFVSTFRTAWSPVRWNSPFEWLPQPLVWNINPFERLSYAFVKNIKPFKRLGHPFVEDIRPFERLGHLYSGIPLNFLSNDIHGRRSTLFVQKNSLVRAVI